MDQILQELDGVQCIIDDIVIQKSTKKGDSLRFRRSDNNNEKVLS